MTESPVTHHLRRDLPIDQQLALRTAAARLQCEFAVEFPKPWTDEIVQAADVVITMGCADACPIFPGKRYESWDLPDPAGQSVDALSDLGITVRR